MKKLFFVALLIGLFNVNAFAANTGPVHALEGQWGPKYSGAPSQAMAGVMGLMFDEIKNDRDLVNFGVVENPNMLHKLGYKDVKKGDAVEMTRIGEHMWKLKLMSGGKSTVMTLKPKIKK